MNNATSSKNVLHYPSTPPAHSFLLGQKSCSDNHHHAPAALRVETAVFVRALECAHAIPRVIVALVHTDVSDINRPPIHVEVHGGTQSKLGAAPNVF